MVHILKFWDKLNKGLQQNYTQIKKGSFEKGLKLLAHFQRKNMEVWILQNNIRVFHRVFQWSPKKKLKSDKNTLIKGWSFVLLSSLKTHHNTTQVWIWIVSHKMVLIQYTAGRLEIINPYTAGASDCWHPQFSKRIRISVIFWFLIRVIIANYFI